VTRVVPAPAILRPYVPPRIRGGIGMPQTRSLQAKVALAFLAVIVGFVGAIVYVPVALWPVAERAESIPERRAEAVRVLGEVRGAARELRSAALLAYQPQWGSRLQRRSRSVPSR
jgi:hypothetical protein